MSDTALLLIDLQRDFLETNGRLPVGGANADRVITTPLRLLNHALNLGWKLVFIKNEFAKNDWLGNFLRKNSAIAGSPGAEIDPRIPVPARAHIFSKAKSDAFSNPSLEPCGVLPIPQQGGFEWLIHQKADSPLVTLAPDRGLLYGFLK